MRMRKLAVVVLLVVIIGFLAYSVTRTSGDDSAAEAVPTTTTTTEPPRDIEISEPAWTSHAAEEAALQGLSVAFTWYPAIDATQNDAYSRARKWLTDNLAERMDLEANTVRPPSIRWDRWAQQQAKILADVTIGCSGCPPDTDTVVRRVATIKQTAIVGNTTGTVTPDTTVWVTVVRNGDRWLIDDICY